MKSYMKLVQARPLPSYVRQMLAQWPPPKPVRSRVAEKVMRWLSMLPPECRCVPVLSTEAARAIKESVTATGRALRELGWHQRKGGAVGDPIRLRGRRVWMPPSC